MIGVIATDEALRMARDAGLDLVEVSPNERPPVCRIMDYGKHKYNQSKKLKQKHHEQKIKEVRFRPKTDQHDKEVKMRRARGFLEQGDRVQFTMLFRGRERFHLDVGRAIFDGLMKELADVAKVDRPARAFGRRMTMVLAPLKTAPPPKPKPKQKAKGKPKPAQSSSNHGDAATAPVAAPPPEADTAAPQSHPAQRPTTDVAGT